MCVLCLFVRVNFFRLKKVNCLDNLNYITNEIHPITNLKLFYHNLFQLSQSFSIITIFFNYHNPFSITTIFFITIFFITVVFNYYKLFQLSHNLFYHYPFCHNLYQLSQSFFNIFTIFLMTIFFNLVTTYLNLFTACNSIFMKISQPMNSII